MDNISDKPVNNNATGANVPETATSATGQTYDRKNSIYARKLGAVWVKQAKNGTSFLSGDITIEGVTRKILIMKNLRKISEKYPDYEIFLNQNEVAKDFFEETPGYVVKKDKSEEKKTVF